MIGGVVTPSDLSDDQSKILLEAVEKSKSLLDRCPYCRALEFRYSTCREGVQCKKCGMRWDVKRSANE